MERMERLRYLAQPKDYTVFDYNKVKPIPREKTLGENKTRRYHQRPPEEKSKVDDESFLLIMHKHPKFHLYLDPRDPLQRVTLAALEKMNEDCPGDVPVNLYLTDCWKKENECEKLKKYGPISHMPILEDSAAVEYWCSGSWPIIAMASQMYQHRHNKLKVYPTEMRKRCRCDQSMFQSYEFLRIVMEEYPNVNGVILRGEKPNEDAWKNIQEMMMLYDKQLNRKPKIDKWYEYGTKTGSDIIWYTSPDVPEFTWMGDDYYQVTDMFAAAPIYTLLSTRLVTEERLFEGHDRVKAWYHRVLEKPSFTTANQQGAKELSDTFHKKLDGQLQRDEFPELKVENYRQLETETLKRFDPN